MSATSFYRAFEDRYRGARDVIKQRLRAYAPFVDALAALGPRPAALDLGCGRGEWLELIGEQGLDARGIDLDAGMLAACHERGLRVEQVDAVAALRACADDSLALVSAFHLVEHVPFAVLQTLIDEALRVLRPGGLLIMETPNPENLTVGATSFYLDPSHEKPLPPLLLGFLAEFAGFGRQRTVRLQEAPRLHDAARPLGLIDVLEGVSPDYAIVAQKTAPAAVLARFDAAFAQNFGYSLGALAQRYQQDQAQQHDALHAALAHQAGELVALNRRHAAAQEQWSDHNRALAELVQRAAANEARLLARLEQNELAVRAAEAHAAALNQQVIAMFNSTSWRLTAPWRLLGKLVRRVALVAGLKRRLRAPLLWLMRAALRQPLLKGALRRALGRLPGLQARLRGLLYRHAGGADGPTPEAPPAAGDMSPRTARIYDDLKKTLETRKH
jgi:O-antigen chain-terminating methyltransferase